MLIWPSPLAHSILAQCPGISITACDRFAFYEEARSSYAIVQCLERRPYGNVILTKGVVGPDGKDLKPEKEGPPKKKAKSRES